MEKKHEYCGIEDFTGLISNLALDLSLGFIDV